MEYKKISTNIGNQLYIRFHLIKKLDFVNFWVSQGEGVSKQSEGKVVQDREFWGHIIF